MNDSTLNELWQKESHKEQEERSEKRDSLIRIGKLAWLGYWGKIEAPKIEVTYGGQTNPSELRRVFSRKCSKPVCPECHSDLIKEEGRGILSTYNYYHSACSDCGYEYVSADLPTLIALHYTILEAEGNGKEGECQQSNTPCSH